MKEPDAQAQMYLAAAEKTNTSDHPHGTLHYCFGTFKGKYKSPLRKRLWKVVFLRLLHPVYRAPDQIIGSPDNAYMLRWWIIPRNSICNIYLHKFLRDDEDRALHDHPWASCSIILKGRYMEHLPVIKAVPHGNIKIHVRKAGNIVFRSADQPHRISLFSCFRDNAGSQIITGREVAWTLFITGPWQRSWGFHCPKGWKPWREFCTDKNGVLTENQVGVGCGEE